MNLELLVTIVAASLLGSTHCAGMCGPFVLLLGGSTQAPGLAKKVMAYHLGRLTTYLLLGAVAGGMGQTLNSGGWLAGTQRGAAYLAAAAMFLSALILLMRQVGVPLRHLPVPQRWVKAIYAGFRRAATWPEGLRAWWVGALTTWIPCGWLYAFVIVAAGTGHVLSGMAIMVAFWLGTVPLLSLVGVSAQSISHRWRVATPWIAIASCLVLGWMSLAHRSSFDLVGWAASSMQAADSVPQRTTTKLPCCHDD